MACRAALASGSAGGRGTIGRIILRDRPPGAAAGGGAGAGAPGEGPPNRRQPSAACSGGLPATPGTIAQNRRRDWGCRAREFRGLCGSAQGESLSIVRTLRPGGVGPVCSFAALRVCGTPPSTSSSKIGLQKESAIAYLFYTFSCQPPIPRCTDRFARAGTCGGRLYFCRVASPTGCTLTPAHRTRTAPDQRPDRPPPRREKRKCSMFPAPEPFARKQVRVHGAAGHAWLARLPATLAACARRWDLTLGPVER